MSAMMGFYETIGRLLSRKRIRGIETSLAGAGLMVPAESFVGFFLLVTALSSLFMFLIFLHVSVVPKFIYALSPGLFLPDFLLFILSLVSSVAITCIVTFLLFWVVILLQTEARKKAVEDVLPDFLTLMAGNVRAGMTIDQAMWYAAKPEYGLFSIEVRRVVKNAFSGEPIEKSLDRLDMRFNSRVLHRTLLLLKQALATGGEIAEILEETAQDARDVAMHKKDIASTLLVYVIFLVFASTIGAPFLFSVSKTLIGVLATAFAYLPAGGIESSGGMPASFLMTPSAPSISTDEFFWFSMALVMVTSLIASLLLGIIQGGSKTHGIRFFPFMLLLSYLIYFLVSSALESMFASMFF
jgi:flagellar protein FlaJ